MESAYFAIKKSMLAAACCAHVRPIGDPTGRFIGEGIRDAVAAGRPSGLLPDLPPRGRFMG